MTLDAGAASSGLAAVAADQRVAMTLDAGGTRLRFGALRGGKPVIPTLVLPAEADDRDRCLARIAEGFVEVQRRCPAPPAAISFGFPGPADYARGVIADPPNLPAFRGGVALGPMLEDRFGLPVFVHNDGHLFAYGEAIGGLLPHVNGLLERAGRPERFRSLLGVTLGTGFGGGIVCGGELHLGDNGMAAEVWRMQSKRHPETNAEEGACIRAVRREYAKEAGIALAEAPDPEALSAVAAGVRAGDRGAALAAFRRLGEVVGDAVAQATTLLDALVVVGGGLSASWPLFMPSLVDEMNGRGKGPDGERRPRLTAAAFNLQDPDEVRAFLEDRSVALGVPGSGRSVLYNPRPRIGVGVSRLGTSEAIALGAYALALKKIDRGGPG